MSEEGGRLISTIFMLHEGLSQLITMVTFFFSIVSEIQNRQTPKKNAQWRDKSCDFSSTLAVCISEVIQVTDLISHQHHSCPLIIQMHIRTNVCYKSLKFYCKLRRHTSCHFKNWQNWAFSNSCFSRVREDTNILHIASYSPYIG